MCAAATVPVAAQTTAPAAPASIAVQPCRGARAVYDTSCPNYTGFAHPMDADPAPALEGGTAIPADAYDLSSGDRPANPLRQGRGPELQRGLASWYGDRHHGARTASGEAFSKHDFTAAHKTLPFGTRVLVRNPRTGREAVVRITDRGPHTKGRIIDVSKAAAEALGMVARGHDTVVIHALAPGVNGGATAGPSAPGLENTALPGHSGE